MVIVRRIHNLLHPKRGCIIMLHRVTKVADNNLTPRHMAITPNDLERMINGYREMGWRFVSMDNVAEIAKNYQFSIFNFQLSHFNSQLSTFVSFTFDDGYLDTYTTAYPLLKQLGVPFCIYMTRDFYRGTARPQWDSEAKMMNVEQMLEISRDPLCTIGAHTCSHPRLSGLSVEEQHKEMKESKEDLEQLLGKEVRHLAYPHGDYSQDTVKIAAELGFETAVTTSGRFVRDDSRLMELDRLVTF